MAQQAIPDRCDVFVIAGPSLDFAPFEIEIIAEHIAKGRHLYALIDVGTLLCSAPAFLGMEY